MHTGVPTKYASPAGDSLEVPSNHLGGARRKLALGWSLALASLSTMLLASSALAAAAPVGLGSAGSFSVLAGSTVTNTGPTTMFGDLGLSPGSSVTGAPHVLGQTHVDDALSIEAKNALTTAYNDAASRPSSGSSGTDLAGQVFLPGVRTASSSLLLSSGSVTLDAQGDPNAVFIFQIGSTLITGSNTTVSLINGAQACNVFWQVGSSATLGTGTRFVGTVMAAETITANTAATIHGRLLAQTAAVNLDTNTITTSNCVAGIETPTAAEIASGTTSTPVGTGSAPKTVGSSPKPVLSTTQIAARRRAAARRARRRAAARRKATQHVSAHPALPHKHGSFTG
jgi:Ice-binding-like